MKNIIKKPITILTLFFLIFSNNLYVFGAEAVYVMINNKPINFEDATPQIMNQRAMVPIRKTAESLGATVDWNKTTETMTIRKNNDTVVHTMRSKVIVVNGKAITFDTPSAVVKDRLMMPVRMLGEALGNTVEWDNATRTVKIFATEAFVVSFTPDKTTVNSGEKVILSVVGSATTEKIKILDINDNNSIIAESTTYTSNSDGTRQFSVSWVPSVSKNSFKTLKAVPGTLESYNEGSTAYKVAAINVNTDGKGKIMKFDVNKKSVGRGDTVKLTVYADASTEKVKVKDDLDQDLTEVTNYKIEDGFRIFDLSVKMEDRGERELKIYSGSTGGYSDSYESVKITVGGAGSSSQDSNKDQTLSIFDVLVVDDTAFVGENANLRVTTSSDISRVEISDVDDRIIDKVNYPISKKDSDNEYVWDILAKVTESGRNRFTITAYDKDNNKVKEGISINGASYNKSDLQIVKVEQKDYDAVVGDTVKFTVKTTRVANKISVMEGSKELQSITSSSSEGDFKIWTFRIKITDSNKDSLKVVAYGSGSSIDTRKLSTYVGSVEKAKIYDVQLKTQEVALNEYIRVTVYTNASVKKVWVQDADGINVTTKKTTYDSKSGNEYEWEFRIPAEEVGNRVLYTIFAQDDNGNTVDDYFRVKVTK